MKMEGIPQMSVGEVLQPTEENGELVIENPNDTMAKFPRGHLIHRLFEDQVDRTPSDIAAICGEKKLTYAQLNGRANKIANDLLQRGVKPDERVGLYADRSMDSVVGMLAILKAGAAYVPLDPMYPPRRLSFMRQDASLVAILTTSTLIEQMPLLDCPAILLDHETDYFIENPIDASLTSSNLAYVIYTSGSTGQPKGVMVEHRNVLGLVIDNHFAPIGPDDCIAHCASPSFDATTWEVWAPLLAGARLLIVPQTTVLDPLALNRVLVQHSVTAMWLTVGLFNGYVDTLEQAFGGLRHLLIGGDALIPSFIARALHKSQAPRRLVNGYGPTETTTFAATFEIKKVAEEAQSIPIGEPIANTYIHILDEDLNAVPTGATGQICIGGAGVARGYLNQPVLTAERFIVDPFSNSPEARLYMSGDLGRRELGGSVEYLGRSDLQVKIRGFRIELGEVEAALRAFPGVRQAVAVARDGDDGAKRLVGYVVLDTNRSEGLQGRSPGAAYEEVLGRLIHRLRDYLVHKLPPYMIPAIIIPMGELPLTLNGKVDRRALPEPEGRQFLPPGYVDAATTTEARLSDIWKQVLNLERVGVQDNFFELGGDSLMGIEMMGNIADGLNIELPFMTVFQYPTVRQLAEFVDGLTSGGENLSA